MFSKLCHLYDFVDATVAKIVEDFPAEVKCQPGCADCCHAMFDISLIEACYLAHLLQAKTEVLTLSQTAAQQALQSFNEHRSKGDDPAQVRIRCPLLADDDLCRCHEGRPINCRTYGTPTVIHGQGHVCGLSAFDPGKQYPTVNLQPLQESLFTYSEEIAPGHGHQRFTIAQVILAPERFLIPA